MPAVCELCAAPGYGYSVQPLLRLCQSCMALSAVAIFERMLDLGIPAKPRMLDFPE